MVVFDYIKKPIALLLSLLIIISALPVMVLFAGNGDNNNYIEVFDPFGELRQLTSASPNLDTSCTVDFSGSNFSIVGTYDAIKNVEYNNGYNDSEYSIFTDVNLNMHNSSFRVGGWYNALHVRQAYNGHKGNRIQLIFTAPDSGKYKIVPEGISNAGNHSMLLVPKNALNSSNTPEHYTQTFSVIKGTETVWSKTLSLSAQNKVSATDDIASNIEVELAKNEKLIFEFRAPDNWAQCDLYANFDVALVEYLYDEIRDVYFPQENYLVEKSETLQLSPVVVPSTVANSNVTYTVSDTSVLTVDSNGKVTPKAEGYAIVTVITEDGGFTDTATIAVYDKNSPSYSAKDLYSGAVEKLGGIGTIKTVDNDIVSQWNTLYKNNDNYVKHEKISYTDWSEIAFHAANKDEHGNASGVMVYQNSLSIYNGRQDTTPNGTAIEFTAPEYGIYALTSDGNDGLVSLPQLTLNYIGSSSPYYFDVNFYLNDEIIKTIELSATHTSEDFPVFNYLELQKGDKIRIELVTDCWERGGIAIAPKVIRVLSERRESPVTEIVLSESEITLSKNGTKSILATVYPVFTDDKTLVYESNDTAVATVDDKGLITAVGIGEAVIRVSSKKYPTVYAECKVTIDGPTYNALTSIKDSANGITAANTMYNAKFEGLFSAGILTEGEYSDFKYVVNPWGDSKLFTNNNEDIYGNKSGQFVEVYNNNFIQTGSLVANSWVYSGFTVDADGLYTIKPNDNFKDIKLAFANGANSANDLISWAEDYPVYIRITKNGEKIWPADDTTGYELKPSGSNSVQMPTLENLELYKGDIIRVEVLGQNKVARHIMVHYNYDIAMTKSVIPAVKVNGISIDKSYCELIVDETAKISATVSPENATNKNVIYVSSDDTIVSVTAGGVITALKQGTATIYAISGDNAEIKATCTVDVLPKGPEFNVLTSLKETTSNVTSPNTPFAAEFNNAFSAGVLVDGEYSDFKYVIHQWGQSHRQFTNNSEDLVGGKSTQAVEYYNDSFVQTASWVSNSWVYTGFTVSEDGMYTLKPNSAFKNIELVYTNGANNANALIEWGEDYPVYIRITKNGQKIWPLGDTEGYELKPSGENSVAMPTLEGLELYKGDVIRVEVLGQNKVNRHVQVSYNYDIAMRKTITPAVKAEGISLPKSSYEIYTGDTLKLKPTVTPQNATNKNVRYESSDTSVVTVSASGVVTAVKNGNAKIYVISCDNETVKTSCDIKVIQKGPTKNVITSLKETADNVLEANKVYDAKFKGQTSAGILKNGEYTDFKYVVNQWGQSQRQFTNEIGDTTGTKSKQYVEVNNDLYTSTGSWVADSWVYTAFTVDADGIYNFKPNKNFKNIELGYINGAANANALVSWGEDYPVYIRITKNGEKIWPLGDTAGYELKPGGTNSVAMPELKDMELYKGDIIRVEVLGQNKVGRHLEVRYNYDIEMMKAITPSVKVSGIKLNKTSCELFAGDTLKLTATVTPKNASNKNVRYISSDESVLSVSSTGLVTALKKGSATITAISYDNNDVKETCVIKVVEKAASYNIVDSLNEIASIVKKANTIYDAKFNSISAGVLSNGEYTDFDYVVNQWGQTQKMFTNTKEDLDGTKSKQFVELYGSNFVQVGSWNANNWVYTGYEVEADGIYTLKPNSEFKSIQLAYLNGANSAKALIDWGEDYPIFIRITKNGEKIWPAGNTEGYELKPSGNNSLEMPTLESLELYKGDVIRVEVSGQNKVGRHLAVRYNYDIDMLKAITPAVRANGISLDKKAYELSIGQSVKLNATVTPKNATNKNVRFKSSNPEVATVSASGVVTSLKQGKTTIYAISCDDNNIKASCDITVTSFEVIDYSPLDLFPSIEQQLNGKISVTSMPIEFDTNWSAQGLNSKGVWEDAYNLTTYDWNKDNVIDCREFGYGWKNAVGIEGKQPYMLSESGTVSLLFTASRAGIYRLSPDPSKSMISIPNTYLTSRVPVKDRDKEWTFKIYNNDKELFSTVLSCNGVNAVELPTIENIKMTAGDNIRFVLENCEAAESQIDIWFAPIISLITPDKQEYSPIGTDREYMLEPNTSIEGKIKAVHPNGLNIFFKDISPKSSNRLVIAEDGSFTYTPKKDYKGIDEREIRLSDEKGKTSIVKLKFIVSVAYDGAQIIMNKLLSFDPKATGVVQNMTFDDSVWRYQYTYDALTYPNGSPKYYDTDLAECIENPGWKGYTAYANGMPQATIHYSGNIPIIDIMAGEKPWNTSPVGSATFVAPNDGTYLLKANEKYNKFVATNAGENGITKPIKVWISKNGQKIWPVNESAVELTAENSEIEFPELQIAMKMGDTVKICVSGHPANARKNTVAIAPIMYDIGAYNEKLDPVTEPEGGVIIVDDDGEPRVRYTNFSLRKSKKSVSDDPFIEPIIDKEYTVDKITKLKKLAPFKMSVTYKECVGVDTYVVNVYRETEYGYELFAEQSTTELTVEFSDFIEGKYSVQVLALDKKGQYIEIYTARDFKVTKNGGFKFGGISIVTLIIILGSVTILAVLAGGYVFIIRKRRK